jgi:hypothetical protein
VYALHMRAKGLQTTPCILSIITWTHSHRFLCVGMYGCDIKAKRGEQRGGLMPVLSLAVCADVAVCAAVVVQVARVLRSRRETWRHSQLACHARESHPPTERDRTEPCMRKGEVWTDTMTVCALVLPGQQLTADSTAQSAAGCDAALHVASYPYAGLYTVLCS